jgi:uncharacterized protein involved in exopolysaccharide biosynthesis
VLPLTYKSTTTLLPETDRNKLTGLSQFSGIAQLAGISVPTSDLGRLYPTIATSETVLENVIEKKYQTAMFQEPVDLIQYFRLDEGSPQKNLNAALKELRSSMGVTFDTKTGVVTITVELQEAQFAADVLNAIVSEIDRYMRQKRVTNASEQAKWINSRLKEVEDELRGAEDALREFREKNRRVSDSPELMMRQERLMREETVKSTIYVELKKQYEISRIEEIKNIAIVNVLDSARAPTRKEGPRRGLNTAFALIVLFLGTSAYYALWPVYRAQLRKFMESIRRGPAAQH